MKIYYSPSVVETWLQVATSQDINLAHQKEIARNRIKELFGSEEIASIYIEQLRSGCQDYLLEFNR